MNLCRVLFFIFACIFSCCGCFRFCVCMLFVSVCVFACTEGCCLSLLTTKHPYRVPASNRARKNTFDYCSRAGFFLVALHITPLTVSYRLHMYKNNGQWRCFVGLLHCCVWGGESSIHAMLGICGFCEDIDCKMCTINRVGWLCGFRGCWYGCVCGCVWRRSVPYSLYLIYIITIIYHYIFYTINYSLPPRVHCATCATSALYLPQSSIHKLSSFRTALASLKNSTNDSILKIIISEIVRVCSVYAK